MSGGGGGAGRNRPAGRLQRPPRGFAVLTVCLQTGIRVRELCAPRLSDVDLEGRRLSIRSGKGKRERVMELERKAISALTFWPKARPQAADHLFLNSQHESVGERGPSS